MDDPPHLGLSDMVIRSVDSLRATNLSSKIPPTWNDKPPLLRGPRNTEESPNLLKGVLRQGIPPALRCAVWLSNVIQAVHPHEDPSYWHEYRTLAKVEALGNAYDALLKQVTSSGSTDDSTLTRHERQDQKKAFWETFPLPSYRERVIVSEDIPTVIPGTTQDGNLCHKRVLVAIHRLLGLTCAPLIPSIASLLLTAQSESYAFCSLREMAHQPAWFFPISASEHRAHVKAFGAIMAKLHPQTAEYLDDRGVLDFLDPFFVHFFVSYIPIEYVLRILDLYTLEGLKVVYRFGVSLLVLFRMESAKDLLTISNAEDWWKYFKEWSFDKRKFNFESVTRKAYGVHGHGIRRRLRFPRRHILQRIVGMEEQIFLTEQHDKGTMESDKSTVCVSPLGIVEKGPEQLLNDTDSEVIKPILASSIEARLSLAQWMPLTLRLSNLDLMYSTDHHGRSLEMFYNKVKRRKHTIVLCEVLDSENKSSVVGMFAPAVWRISPHVYGDGSCFIFRLAPDPQCWKWKPRPPRNTNTVDAVSLDDDDTKKDNETALLEQFMVSTDSFLSMGGNKDGSAGLRLNEDLTVGESSTAEGFENPPLHGGTGSVFSVGLVEVYGLASQIDGRAL